MTYNNIERTRCFVGKSNWDGDPYLNGCVDELKIFDQALNQKDIITEMNINSTKQHSNGNYILMIN